MKLSFAFSVMGLSVLLALSSLNCSSSSPGKADGAAGSDGGAGSAGHDGAAGSDGGGAAGSDGGGAAGSDGGGAAGSDGGTTDGDAAASSDGATDGGDGGGAASALETAELALTDGTDLNVLTATHTELASGEQTPIGWGPRTLPSQAQRDAATALIRRIASLLPASARNGANTEAYTAADVNVLNGLLTLNADPNELFAGTSLAPAAGTAWEAYKAGAVSDTSAPAGPFFLHGVAAGSPNALFGAYIATNGTDPEGVVGLATNIVKVALQHGLETQLKAF